MSDTLAATVATVILMSTRSSDAGAAGLDYPRTRVPTEMPASQATILSMTQIQQNQEIPVANALLGQQAQAEGAMPVISCPADYRISQTLAEAAKGRRSGPTVLGGAGDFVSRL